MVEEAGAPDKGARAFRGAALLLIVPLPQIEGGYKGRGAHGNRASLQQKEPRTIGCEGVNACCRDNDR